MKHIILECANFAPHDELQKGFANYYMETNYVDENRFLNQKLLQTARARFMHGWSRNNVVRHSCEKLLVVDKRSMIGRMLDLPGTAGKMRTDDKNFP